MNPLLSVEDLFVSFSRSGNTVQAVAGVSFTLDEGETLGLVGESGCGKSTTGRAVVQVEKPTSGKVTFGGTELTSLDRGDLRQKRTEMQMIFQDPISSLNPRRRVADIVAEPLNIWKIGTKEERVAKVDAMLESVGIDPSVAGNRYPREFSGGQCQRISIARALVLEPKLLVCDEIVSALDVSVQAQILNLLEDLKAHHNLTLLFIAHDLAVVKNVSDRVAVMYLGRLCEIAPSDVLYAARASLHRSAVVVRRRAQSRRHPDAGHSGRRAAEPHQPALGMSLPYPLPTLPKRAARKRTPSSADRAGSLRGLSLPGRELMAPRCLAVATSAEFPELLDERRCAGRARVSGHRPGGRPPATGPTSSAGSSADRPEGGGQICESVLPPRTVIVVSFDRQVPVGQLDEGGVTLGPQHDLDGARTCR